MQANVMKKYYKELSNGKAEQIFQKTKRAARIGKADTYIMRFCNLHLSSSECNLQKLSRRGGVFKNENIGFLESYGIISSSLV